MATPYSDATNEHEKEFLERHGLSVVKMAGLQLSGQMQKVSRIPPVQVFEHAASVDCKEAEAILICCTDFGSLDVIEKLETNLQKPVVSSNTASFWYSLRRAGISDRIDGYGTLLKILTSPRQTIQRHRRINTKSRLAPQSGSGIFPSKSAIE